MKTDYITDFEDRVTALVELILIAIGTPTCLSGYTPAERQLPAKAGPTTRLMHATGWSRGAALISFSYRLGCCDCQCEVVYD